MSFDAYAARSLMHVMRDLEATHPEMSLTDRANLAAKLASNPLWVTWTDNNGTHVNYSDEARKLAPNLPHSSDPARNAKTILRQGPPKAPQSRENGIAKIDAELSTLQGKTDERSVNRRITLKEQRARAALGTISETSDPTTWDREHGAYPTRLTEHHVREIAGPLGKALGFQYNAERSTVTPRRWEAHATLDTRSDGDRFKSAAEREARARAALRKRGIPEH